MLDEKTLYEDIPFSIHIYYAKLVIDTKHIIDNIYCIKNYDLNGVTKSNRGGWQSQGFEFGDGNNLFMNHVFNEIKPCIENIYKDMGINQQPMAQNYWFNVNKKYDYNIAHKHGNSYFSAALYLKVPQNSGKIIFERPDPLRDWITNLTTNNKNYSTYEIQPEENMIIIFPAFLSHYVERNMSDEDRISIAFNFR